MSEQGKTDSGVVLVALDIAKKSHDAVVLMPNGKRFYTKVANSREGYQQLLSRTGADPNQVKVGFEPTADYHRNIAYWLAEAGCQCFLVSSLASNRAREMLYQTWDKNDRKDARVILYLMEQNIMESFHDPLRSGVMDIQELSNTYHQISMARTRVMNSLFNHYVSLYFPEIERFFNSTRSEWFCRFMLKYPTPASITRYKLETFTKRAWEVVGRKVSKTRLLTELYDAASNSVGIPVAADSVAVETFKLQVRRFYDLTLQRAKLESKAGQFLSAREDYQHLRTIPGVGPIVAMIILAESGDLRRFKHYRQYLNFCGFNLSAQQSGSKPGQYHLSKRGNARLRYAYWLAATSAIRQQENLFRAKFARYIHKDPENQDLKRKGRVAIATKMARIAHALVKTGSDYRGFYEFSRGT